MSLTLDQLKVERPVPSEPGVWRGWEKRPASLADLVEVLKQEGATIEVVGEPGYAEKDGWVEPGRYLVLPLEDTP